MKKRVLSLVLTVLMIVSMFTMFVVPASAASIGFTIEPSVLIGGGDEYNIVWQNNNVSIGWVSYVYQGKTYTVYDEENGVVRSDDNIHTVRVPMAHLDAAGSYTVTAATVTGRDGYDIKLSDQASVQRSFKGYKDDGDLSIGYLSDSHLLWNNATKYAKMLQAIETCVNNYMNRPDLVVLNGDITNNMTNEQEFVGLFKIFEAAGANGTTPVLYVMGNHEKRGAWSIRMEKYLTYDTGEFYTKFDFGPASIIVTDIGEDKTDDHIEYGELNDMDHYFEEMYSWLQLHPGFSSDAQYQFTIGHSPSYVDRFLTDEIVNVLANLGTDVHICGHNHQLMYQDTTKKVSFPVVSDGGHNDNEAMRSMLMTMKGGVYTFKGMDAMGGETFSRNLEASPNSAANPNANKLSTEIEETVEETIVPETEDVIEETVEETVEDVAIPTQAGMSTAAIKGAADTTALTTKPVVFDVGDYYNVVWQTTAGVPCGGYVEIAGQKKIWMDSHGGKLRTETTHSVRIPKSTLSGKTYTIKSRVVTNYNAYGYYNQNDPTTYGPWAEGSPVKFASLPGDNSSKYTILAVANKTQGKADAAKLKAKYKSTPNLLVLLGDMTADLNNESDFGKSILDYANEVTGGSYPVMFLRGEGETKGAFAANLSRFIRPMTTELVTNRLYTSTTFGSNYSIIGLDTAGSKADNDGSYNGYAAFNKLRKEQAEWLGSLPKSFAGKYNLVFANSSNLSSCHGVNFTENFDTLNIHLAVTAGSGDASFADGGAGYSQASVGDSLGLVITCAKDEITVESIADEKTTIGTVDVTAVSYDPDEVKPIEPTDPEEDPKEDPSDEEPTDEDPKDEEPTDEDPKDEEPTDEDPKDDDDKEDDDSKDPGSTSVDAFISIQEVADDWYEDYLYYNVDIVAGAEFELDGDIPEGEFIYVVTRLAGANLSLYDEGSAIESAAAWAKAVGITTLTLSGSDNIKAGTAESVIAAIVSVK